MSVEASVVRVGGPVIVGAGLAGLMTAIELSPIPCIGRTSVVSPAGGVHPV